MARSGGSGQHRQDRRGAIQGLDLGLLVDAEHDRVLRRVQIEADDVADLGFELRVGGKLEGSVSPRLHAVGAPRPRDGRVADPEVPAQQPRGPVCDGQRCRWRLQRRGDDLRVIDRPGPAAARQIAKPTEPVGDEPVAPLDHRRARDPDQASSRRGPRPVSDREHHPRPLSMPSPDRRAPRPILQRRAILIAQRQLGPAILSPFVSET